MENARPVPVFEHVYAYKTLCSNRELSRELRKRDVRAKERESESNMLSPSRM